MNKKEVLDIAHRIFAQCKIIRKARLYLPMIHPRFVIGEAVDNIGRCISELEDLCGKPTAKETEKPDETKPTDPNNTSYWDAIGEEMKRKQELKLRENNDLLRQANIRLTAERDLYDRLYHELLDRAPGKKSTALGNPGRNVPKARLHKCEDCAKYDACRSFTFLPTEPFVDENGRCKLFVKKPPKMKDLMNKRVWKPMCDYVARLRKRFEEKREAEVLKELAKAKREEEKAIWSSIHKTMQKKAGDDK